MIGPLVPYLSQAWPPGRNLAAPERPANQADPAPAAAGGPDDPAPLAPGAAGAPVLTPPPPPDQPAPGLVQPAGRAETPPDHARRPAPPPLAARLNPLHRVA